jgi:adenylate cyclase class 2
MNSLYDLPGRRLLKRGEMLRLRKYGDTWILTHKAKSKTGRHKVRVELETPVENGPQMDAILSALGFAPTFRYEKYRAAWSDGTGHVVLDETPIGNFGEIEGSPRWIDRTARTLGIDRSDYITQTYAPMFFAWKQRTHSPATEMTFRAVRRKRD